VPDILDAGRAGRLVPPGDPAALAAALVDLLGDAAERGRLGSTLRDHVQAHYGPDAVWARLEPIYAGAGGAGG
jgi:glycosyltransferase involved in cell wall biosynthesis